MLRTNTLANLCRYPYLSAQANIILRRSSVLLCIGSNHFSLFLDYMHFRIERQSSISIILSLLIILYAQMQIKVQKKMCKDSHLSSWYIYHCSFCLETNKLIPRGYLLFESCRYIFLFPVSYLHLRRRTCDR